MTLLQSKATGCAGVAPEAGDSSEGAAGAGGGFTVNAAVRVSAPSVAETVADVAVVTAVVVTLKLALVAPAGTVTLAGVEAAVELSARDTTTPPLGAAPVNVTVPVDELPPTTVVGFNESAESVAAGGGGFTASVAERDAPANVPVIVAVVDADTAVVDTAKLALLWPAGTVTLAGTTATALFDDRATEAPPLGAAEVKTTVPVDGLPPTTPGGFTETVDSPNGGGGPDGFTVRVADRVTPLKVAVSVTSVDCATANVRIRKSAKVPPCPTVTFLATTTAAWLLLVKATETAPSLGSGAAGLMRTLPIDRVPPATAAGLTVRSVSAGVAVEKTNGLTFIDVDRLTPPKVAVMVTGVVCVTAAVVTPNTVAVCPGSTVTVAGTEAAPLLDDSDTTAPPAGATPFRITWPIEGLPCTTEIGVVSTEKTASGPAGGSRPADGTTAR